MSKSGMTGKKLEFSASRNFARHEPCTMIRLMDRLLTIIVPDDKARLALEEEMESIMVEYINDCGDRES